MIERVFRAMLRSSLLGLVLLVPPVQSAIAQTSIPAAASPVPAVDTPTVLQQGTPTVLPVRPAIFSRSDAFLAAGFGLGMLALFPLDQQFATRLQSPALQGNRSYDRAATTLEKITSPGAYYIGGSLFIVGKLAGFDRAADMGLHVTESVLLAEGIGFVLKRGIGRARPYVSDAQNSRDFSVGTGFGTGDRRSLPSGHTYTAFALASAMTSELRSWKPRSAWFVAPVLYGGASLVGLSRMYHNQHWASDIALGAAIGTFSGLKLTHFMHRNDQRGSGMLAGAPVVQRDADATRLGWRLEF